MARDRTTSSAGKLRIIGGSLRGSKLAIPEFPGLRPTPDRVRETLFNWLMPVIEGARCLDLFAGTGALGIEALSRGAAWVDFVERDAALARDLRENLARLRQTQFQVSVADGTQLFDTPAPATFDIVFVDPPFSAGLWESVAIKLESAGCLRAGSLVYLEMPIDENPALPETWELHRESRAGAVRYALYRRSGPSAKL